MAEAIGLAASIIAVAGLAKSVIQFDHYVSHITRDMKTVRGDILRSVSRISFFAKTIDSAQKVLYDYCERQKSANRSTLIDLIESQDASEYLERESWAMQDQLRQLKSEISSLLEARWTLLVTLKWRHFLEKEVKVFQDQMHYIQVSLTLIMQSVMLEMELIRKNRDEIVM